MAGTPSADHLRAFVNSGDAALGEMVSVIDRWPPDLVVTYDPHGGYGHPDHIRAHEVTHAALERTDHRPRRGAWTVSARSTLSARHAAPASHLRPPAEAELPARPDARVSRRA